MAAAMQGVRSSCGACWESFPEFFEENLDDGFSQVVEKYGSGSRMVG
jgi:bacterioferritin-associated ferredoxin